ncbi:hypothetical protein AgCh_018560 [Apium graveolens]
MSSLPLHSSRVHKLSAIINISHTFIHFIALALLIYYRLSSFLYTNSNKTVKPPFLPWLLTFLSELILSLLWILHQPYGWRPLSRTTFPENLPEDDKLPGLDVFVCTADPVKEPPLNVMNTVISAMALDYPPEKLSVYLSDDGGSSVTLHAIREAWRFAKPWIRFCRRYGIKTRCPELYFAAEDGGDHGGYDDFSKDRENIKRMYEQFAESLEKAGSACIEEDNHARLGQTHPPFVEIIRDNDFNNTADGNVKMPLVAYVSREKRIDYPHHFKAGALNVLLRVSGIISNSPYILVLDCDMYVNDASSARQAMCFHLDQRITSSLAFVQFPQRFHNISNNDIYGSALKPVFELKWPGLDGLRGPLMSGTCYYIKRKALYGNGLEEKGTEISELKCALGMSNEFLKSLGKNIYKCNDMYSEKSMDTLIPETKLLASCLYEENTQWGQQEGFMYLSVVEDYFTGFTLHCKGRKSVFCNPSNPAFLGTATTNLNDTLVQGTRWTLGLLEVVFSRFCPLIYGPSRMPILQAMCYQHLAFQPFYCLPVFLLATIPQLCLLNHIQLYPEVSSPWFTVFSLVFISSLLKYLTDIVLAGGTIQMWWNEWRMWMIKSVTSYFYGTLNGFRNWLGMKKAYFTLTTKVANEEQFERYLKGKFDFQASPTILYPMVSLVILNLVSFTWGFASVIVSGGWRQMFGQIFLSFHVVIVGYPIIEGMILRCDNGRIPGSVTLPCFVLVMMYLSFGSLVLMYVK